MPTHAKHRPHAKHPLKRHCPIIGHPSDVDRGMLSPMANTIAPPSSVAITTPNPALAAPPPPPKELPLAAPLKALRAKQPNTPSLGKAAGGTAAALRVGPAPTAQSLAQATEAMAQALHHLPNEPHTSAWDVTDTANHLAHALAAATQAVQGHPTLQVQASEALDKLIAAARSVTVGATASPLLGQTSRARVLRNLSLLCAALPSGPAAMRAHVELREIGAQYGALCAQEKADQAFRLEGLQALVTLASDHALPKADLAHAVSETYERLQQANTHGDIVTHLRDLVSALHSDNGVSKWMTQLRSQPRNPTILSEEAAAFESFIDKLTEVPLESPSRPHAPRPLPK